MRKSSPKTPSPRRACSRFIRSRTSIITKFRKANFGKEFLFNTQIAKTTIGVGYGGQQLSSRVVYWELKGNKVNLRSVDYDVVADPKTPIAQAVQAANNNAIIMSFPVAAFSADKNSAVIEVTRLFSTDVYEFSARQRLNASSMDASRSYIERVSPYPENIEAEASHTYTRQGLRPAAAVAAALPPADVADPACVPAARRWFCITAW